MEWSQDTCFRLIRYYKKHQLLWDSEHESYFNLPKKEDAWNDIAQKLGRNVEDCKRKMDSLKGSFRREKARMKKSATEKRPTEAYVSRWFAFEAFQFLNRKDRKKNEDYGSDSDDEEPTPPKRITNNSSTTLSAVNRKTSQNNTPSVNNNNNNRNIVNVRTSAKVNDVARIKQPKRTNENSSSVEDSRRTFPGNNNSGGPAAKKTKKKHQDEDCRMMSEALAIMKSAAGKLVSFRGDNQEAKSFGDFVASKMSSYSTETSNAVQHAIFDILIKADTGQYERYHYPNVIPPTTTRTSLIRNDTATATADYTPPPLIVTVNTKNRSSPTLSEEESEGNFPVEHFMSEPSTVADNHNFEFLVVKQEDLSNSPPSSTSPPNSNKSPSHSSVVSDDI